MADDTKTTKSGVWFDTKARKVVESEPEEGILLAAPGAELTPTVNATIEQYRSVDEDATDPNTVTTATAKSPSAKK
jgi:hypothetical protein